MLQTNANPTAEQKHSVSYLSSHVGRVDPGVGYHQTKTAALVSFSPNSETHGLESRELDMR